MGQMTQITQVDVRVFDVPLAEVLTDAKHGDHTHFELVTATVRLKDGSEGTGYTYTGGKGGRAIVAMIEHDPAMGEPVPWPKFVVGATPPLVGPAYMLL